MSAALFAEARAVAGRITSEEWVEGGRGAFPAPSGSGANASGMLAMLAANDLGWVVGQLGPLQVWMDGLDSDVGGVASFAQSWQSAATGLQGVGDAYSRRLGDVGGMSGRTIDAYVAHGEQIAEALRVQGELVGAVAVGVQTASQLVKNVHGQVQDGVVEVAAFALAVKTRSVLSGGKMTPAMVAQVSAKTAEVSGRVGPMVAGVVSVLALFGILLRLLWAALQAIGKWLTKLFTKAPKPKPKPKAKEPGGKPKGKDSKKDKDPKDKSKDSTPIAKPPKVKDPDLQNRLKDAYLREGQVPKKGGDGSLVDAIKYEKRTGEKIGDKDHVKKGQNVRNSLENWLKKNKDADPSDIETAQRVLQEIKDALNGN